MKKPPGRKKAVSAKRAAPVKRASLKKPGPQRTEEAKKKVKQKLSAQTASTVKKTKTAAKPAARSSEKTKKPSRTKKAGKEPAKTAGKSSAVTARTSRRPAVRKTAPTKTAAKTTLKKLAKETAGSLPAAAERTPTKTVPEATGKKVTQVRDVKTARIDAWRELPQEYGESEVIVMPVDPHVIFVDWEIRKEEIPAEDSIITMRVFDATTGYTDSESLAKKFFELRLEGRIGSGFFDIGMPGRNVAVEIGLDYNGTFLPILESPAVSMPEIVVFDELGIAQKLFESGVPVGY